MSKLWQLYIGGYGEMITILHRGGVSLGTPKSDYVICARPLIAKLILILCTKYATQGFGFECPKIFLFWKGAVSYPTLPVFCTPSFKCWRILNPTALQEGKGRGVFKVKNIVIWRQSIAKTRFSSIGIEWPGLCSRAGLSELWTPVNFMWVTMTIGRVFSSIGQVVSSISCE